MLHNLRNKLGLGVVIAFTFAGGAACSPLDLPAGDEYVVPAALVASNDDASPEATQTGAAPVVTLTAGPTRTEDASETPEASATPGVGATSVPTGTVTSTPMPARGEVELRGILSAINGDTWIVNGVTVIVGPRTEIKGNPRVDGQVKVEGQLQANGSVLAREITGIGLNPTQSSRPERGAEIRGLIRAMNGNTWLVDGFTVIIGERTEITGSPIVGSPVKIVGQLQADGSLLAREVKVLEREGTRTPEAGEVEFRGVLRAMEGERWIVGDVTVVVSRRTEIEGNPMVGDMVKVEGQRQGDGTVAAREIEVLEREGTRTPEAGKVEFRGLLRAMNGDTWIIDGVTVIVSRRTEIKGNPVVGDVVKVEGQRQGDGTVAAREIEVLEREGTRTPEAGKVEFRGLLRAMNGDTWIIDGVTVIVSRRTQIEGDPMVGDMVKVEGQRQGDGTVAAREIEVVGRDATGTPVAGIEIEFTGTLQVMDGGRFVVNGITVVLGPNAEIKGPLGVGDLVKVHGTPQPDGSVIAREIERADRDNGGGDDDHDGEDNSGRGGGDDDNSGGNNGGEHRGGDDNGGSGGGGSDDDNNGRGGDEDDRGGAGDDHEGGGGGGDDDGGGDDSGGRGGDDKP
jgi:hypothetical protein